MVLALAPSRQRGAAAAGLARRGQVGWPTGIHIVVDRAEDMFFVLMEDAPSGRMYVQVTLKKIIYDAFEK
jgi:hypothetical protein